MTVMSKTVSLLASYSKPKRLSEELEIHFAALGTMHLVGSLADDVPMTVISLHCHIRTEYKTPGLVFIFTACDQFQELPRPVT